MALIENKTRGIEKMFWTCTTKTFFDKYFKKFDKYMYN